MLGLLAKIYESAVRRRNSKFDNNRYEILSCNVPVISVGNLTVGGTGKTPFVELLARYFLKIGKKPAIVGRGYKGKAKGELIVSDGKNIKCNTEEAGDEMMLLAKKLKVPVLVHKIKYLGAKSAEKNFDPDIIIVDDGFQHRKLHRDMDIVLIDKETLQNPALMPKGRLREPLSSLSRADVICFMGVFDISSNLKDIIKDKITIRSTGSAQKPFNLLTDKKITLREKKELEKGIIAVSGIANPGRFVKMLGALKYPVIKQLDFPDHYRYNKQSLKTIYLKCKEMDCLNIAATEKDAVKIEIYKDDIIKNGMNFYIFPFSLKIVDGEKEFHNYLKKILKKDKGKQ